MGILTVQAREEVRATEDVNKYEFTRTKLVATNPENISSVTIGLYDGAARDGLLYCITLETLRTEDAENLKLALKNPSAKILSDPAAPNTCKFILSDYKKAFAFLNTLTEKVKDTALKKEDLDLMVHELYHLMPQELFTEWLFRLLNKDTSEAACTKAIRAIFYRNDCDYLLLKVPQVLGILERPALKERFVTLAVHFRKNTALLVAQPAPSSEPATSQQPSAPAASLSAAASRFTPLVGSSSSPPPVSSSSSAKKSSLRSPSSIWTQAIVQCINTPCNIAESQKMGI